MFEQSNAIYHNVGPLEAGIGADHDIQCFTIHGLEIPFSAKWKKIGMNLSGGADSACLTYLLCKIITENNFNCTIDIITHVRCWTTRPWQGPVSVEVYKKLKDMFPNIIGDRHENFITPELEHGVSGNVFRDLVYTDHMRSGDQVSIYGFNEYCVFKHKLDAIFNATSQNPLEEDFPKKMANRQRTASEGEIRDLLIYTNERFLCHPFRFVDKSWIIAQYHLFGITDLLNITRSCEGDVNAKVIKEVVSSHKEYIPGMKVPECGTCFWCLERDWATAKLDETLEKIKHV
jgi:hypothetical protein